VDAPLATERPLFCLVFPPVKACEGFGRRKRAECDRLRTTRGLLA
jgi:hypothetical protein